jgi:hypothetical protein
VWIGEGANTWEPWIWWSCCGGGCYKVECVASRTLLARICDTGGSLTKSQKKLIAALSCRFGNGGTQLTFRAQTIVSFFFFTSFFKSRRGTFPFLFRFSFVYFRTFFLGVMRHGFASRNSVYVFSK